MLQKHLGFRLSFQLLQDERDAAITTKNNYLRIAFYFIFYFNSESFDLVERLAVFLS